MPRITRAAVLSPRIGYNDRMNWDEDWISCAGAAATVVTVTVGFSLLGFWFGG
jgi:hypothetical protein